MEAAMMSASVGGMWYVSVCCCRGCCSCCEWYEEGEKGNHQPEVRARRTLSIGRQFGRPAVSVCAGSFVTHTSGLPVWRANNTSSLAAVACASNLRLGVTGVVWVCLLLLLDAINRPD